MIKTILLVDADPLSIASIRKVLARTGLRVQLALDGRAAVAEFRRLRPDLVLLQDHLPVLDGLEACRRMKQISGAEDIAVAILTSPRSHDVLLETGCDAYVEKPFEDEELLDVVRELIARTPVVPRPDDVAIDLPARYAIGERSGLPVELSEEDVDLHLSRVLGGLI